MIQQVREFNSYICFLSIDIASGEFCNYMKVELGEEVKEQDMDVISLSSSTTSDFDVITEDEINLLK